MKKTLNKLLSEIVTVKIGVQKVKKNKVIHRSQNFE